MLRIQSTRGAQDTSGSVVHPERRQLRETEVISRDCTESQILVYSDNRLEVSKDCLSKSGLSVSKRLLLDDEEVDQDY